MELTLENINNSSIIKICKILGVSLMPGKTLDDQYREEIKNTLILRGKYDGFNEILDFINKSGRNNINSFLFKVKKEIDKISSEDWYKNINLDEIKSKRANLEKLKENKLRSYAHTGNDKQYCLSIDIKSANFTMLREIGNILEDTWPKYLKRVYPNDVRTDRNRNVELGMNGLITEIPDCIYESKWFRQFLLSDLNKLPVLWEIKILELLEQINVTNKICVNSDEIVILVKNYEEADDILKILTIDENIFKIKKFQLSKIEGFSKNCMLKTFVDGSKALINVNPNEYDSVFKLVYLL